MNTRMSFRTVTALVMVMCSQATPVLLAQNSSQAPASAEAAAPVTASDTSPVKLSFGVTEVLKLGRAHVGDEVIIAFIGNSSRIYNLSVSEIVYLREQGVSDQVVAAMLNTRQNVPAAAAQAAPQPTQQAGPTSVWANSSPQPAPAPTPAPPQPAPAYIQAAPVYTQPSPVYVYTAPSYGYYDSMPYYWGYPGVSFSFGFGGGHYGGYHGGGYHGGGYHGGGVGHH